MGGSYFAAGLTGQHPPGEIRGVTAQEHTVKAPIPWAPALLVGRYTLVTRIATGGMAEIWLARQAGPGGFEKVVAIKKIADTYGQDPDFVQMFLD